MHRFGTTGSSQFVLNEFQTVIGGVYDAITDSFSNLTYPDRPQPFMDLWQTASQLGSKFVYGGPKLLSVFVAGLAARYSTRLVTANEVKNFVRGQKLALSEAFHFGEFFFDCSSCCVWETRGMIECSTGPSATCKLKLICSEQKNSFLSSAAIVAAASREESSWLRKNLARLSKMSELELIESVGRKPGHFGDIIIFWEVPDSWTILTRDKTFTLLQTKTKRAVRIYYVRMPRIVCTDLCDVFVSVNEQQHSATMIDFSATGLCLKCDAPLGPINSVIGVAGPRLNGFREGRIVRAEQTLEGIFYGIKFIHRRNANR